MPYIDQDARVRVEQNDTAETVGELAYLLQRAIEQYVGDHGLKFQTIAEIKGALTVTIEDFNERIAQPYETFKRQRNGDVWDHWEEYL